MAFDRQPVAEQDRRRALAQKIVDRHSDEVREAVWKAHVSFLGSSARHYLKMGPSLPEQMAELLEPGELASEVEKAQ